MAFLMYITYCIIFLYIPVFYCILSCWLQLTFKGHIAEFLNNEGEAFEDKTTEIQWLEADRPSYHQLSPMDKLKTADTQTQELD